MQRPRKITPSFAGPRANHGTKVEGPKVYGGRPSSREPSSRPFATSGRQVPGAQSSQEPALSLSQRIRAAPPKVATSHQGPLTGRRETAVELPPRQSSVPMGRRAGQQRDEARNAEEESNSSKFSSLFDYADQMDAKEGVAGVPARTKGLTILTPRSSKTTAPQQQLSKAQLAKKRWDDACARDAAGSDKLQAPWGEDPSSGPRSPAERIKANRNSPTGYFPPLPADDSALPPEACDSDEDSPVALRQLHPPLSKNAQNQQALGCLTAVVGRSAKSMMNEVVSPVRMDLVQEKAPYIRSIKEQGVIPGYVYKRGNQGLGYYICGSNTVAPQNKPAAGLSKGQTGRLQNQGSSVFGGIQVPAHSGFPRNGNGAGGNKGGGIASKHKDTSLW